MKIFKALLPMIIVFTLERALLSTGRTDWPMWVSILFHGAGGFVTAWSASLFYKYYKNKLNLIISPRILFYTFLVCISALAGILWEIYEFIHDLLSACVYQPSIKDTIYDLISDIVGAVFFILLFRPKIIYKNN